jgi:hypothetical protein
VLAVLIAGNLVAVLLGVVPLSASVAAAEQRAQQAARDATAAAQELREVTAARDGRDAAARDLEIFYRDVLPADVGAARRVLQLRVAQLARTHKVEFARSIASPESVRGSELSRLQVSAELVGTYRDIRAFLYDLETSKDFVIIDSIVLGEGEDAQAPLNLTLHVSTSFKGGASVP